MILDYITRVLVSVYIINIPWFTIFKPLHDIFLVHLVEFGRF